MKRVVLDSVSYVRQWFAGAGAALVVMMVSTTRSMSVNSVRKRVKQDGKQQFVGGCRGIMFSVRAQCQRVVTFKLDSFPQLLLR